MRNKLRSCVFILLLSFSAANIFIEEPSDKLVPSDSTAIISFTCKANVVDPVYTWRKDGSPVDTADGSRFQVHGGTLEISNPQDSDAGDYQCVLSSVDGTVVSNYGKLVFGWVGEFSPSVNEPVTTVVGKGVSIKCPQPSYAPEHSVSFYWEAIDKNTRIQTPCNQSHYVSQTDGTLYIANPTAIDQDTLTCNVRSLWKYNGKPEKAESSIVPLTVDSSNVEFDPEFMLVPKPVTNAKRGGYAIIECFASGRPTPQLSWTKLDGPMPVNHTISEAGQLILKAVTEDMAGTYRCTAVNSKGSTHADGELRLEYAPQWTSPISSFSVDRTTSASIQCGAIAVPTPSFTWLKNGVVLGDSGNINIGNFDGGSQLDIYDVSEADQGMYQCVVSNSHGSIFSSAKMAVVSIPPTIIEPVPDITRAALDNEVIITCDIEAAPAAVIVWTKDTDQVLVIDNNKYTLQSDGLKISNLANGDAGVYNCYAENDMGNVQSEGTLQIYLPTVITTGPQGNEVIVGDLVQMGCQATHDNQLELTWSWTQNGEAISVFDKHYTISGDSILIKDVSSEQAGIYQCCANTDVGTDCASATVVVMAPPEPPTNVMVTNSYENTVTLQWQAGNDNGAAVDLYLVEAKCGFDCSWRFIVTSPIFVNTTTCQVKKLLPNNDYMFRVTAMNKYGTGAPSEPSAVYSSPPGAPIRHPIKIKGASKELGELVVQWQPMQPKYFGDNDISYKVVIRKQVRGDPVVLPVNLNDTNVPPVDDRPWIEQVAIGGTKNQTTFKVNASEIFVPYEVKVQAVNNYGPGPFSLMRVLHTAEKAPTKYPSGIKVRTAAAYSAELEWLYLENENGYTRGYKVSLCPRMEDPSCENPDLWLNYTTARARPHINMDGLKPNYYYVVYIAGFNTAGIGPWSPGDFTLLTAYQPPQTAPSNIEISASDMTLSASWSPVQKGYEESDIQGYKVQYWFEGADPNTARSYYSTTTSVTFDLPERAEYEVWVRAFSQGGDGRPSTPAHVSTLKGVSSGRGGGANNISSSLTLIILAFISAIIRVL